MPQGHNSLAPSNELVGRLRDRADCAEHALKGDGDGGPNAEVYDEAIALDREAAETILRLEAEIAELREALKGCFGIACDYTIDERTARSDIAKIYRASLSGEQSDG